MYSYIHIPFCESKCKYCRFASIWWVNQKAVWIYVWHLLNEIKSFTKNTSKLESIYFGWWTPSILTEENLQKIVYELKNKFWFEKEIEITLETTPQNINLDNLKSWEKIWINRLSVGIQSLNDKTLSEIWRTNKQNILNTLELLKNTSIKNISLDFIIWLPYVDVWELKNDIEFILKNYDYVKHISVYMLEDYYDVEDEAKLYEKITYPTNWSKTWIDFDDYIKEYISILELLKKYWINKYEISNFSKTWYECKHNKSYWNHSENVWFWLWAHSFVSNIRYANSDDFVWYYKQKKSYEEILWENDLFLEKIMFWFRTSWISIDLINKLNKNKIDELLKNWFLEINENKLQVPVKHTQILDYIINEII